MLARHICLCTLCAEHSCPCTCSPASCPFLPILPAALPAAAAKPRHATPQHDTTGCTGRQSTWVCTQTRRRPRVCMTDRCSSHAASTQRDSISPTVSDTCCSLTIAGGCTHFFCARVCLPHPGRCRHAAWPGMATQQQQEQCVMLSSGQTPCLKQTDSRWPLPAGRVGSLRVAPV